MKRTIVFILACFFATPALVSQIFHAKKGEQLSVFAVSGLNLRAEPDTNAKVIAKIAYAEKVQIVDPITGFFETIEDRTGYWFKVQYKNQEGFLFSGYLTKSFSQYNVD